MKCVKKPLWPHTVIQESFPGFIITTITITIIIITQRSMKMRHRLLVVTRLPWKVSTLLHLVVLVLGVSK